MEIIGVVLAGGKSSRMGSDKAALPYRGVPFVERARRAILDAIAETSDAMGEVLISGKDQFGNGVPDRVTAKGPVGGIYSVYRHLREVAGRSPSPDTFLLVLPVDMPLAKGEVLSRLIRELKGAPVDGARYAMSELPVCLRYDLKLEWVLEELKERMTREGETPSAWSVRAMLEALDMRELAIDPAGAIQLANVNTPKEYQEVAV